jgi:hypothetical protein
VMISGIDFGYDPRLSWRMKTGIHLRLDRRHRKMTCRRPAEK